MDPARNTTTITNTGTYNDVKGCQFNTNVNYKHEVSAHERLRASAMLGVAWDSIARSPADTCCKGTRGHVLDNIIAWLEDTGARSKIYLLAGASGLGKSTIAQSLAQHCNDHWLLGASVFFSQSDDNRCNAKGLFTTIAYQLCLLEGKHDKRTRAALEEDPGIIDREPSEQLQALVMGTLSGTLSEDPSLRIAVIIDGMDQGGSHETLEELLPMIVKATQGTPLRFIVTSQMTPAIQAFIQNYTNHIKLSDLYSYDVDDDINLFYHSRFAQLSASRGIDSWYTDEEIIQLVSVTGGLFLYAAAVAKYIENGKRRNPRQRLQDVLSVDIKEFPEIRDRLDALYRRILSQIPQRDYDDLVRRVIGAVCLVAHPLTLEELDTLLGLESGDTWQCLQDLHAFFQIPSIDDRHQCVRLVHSFFRAFICDPQRSGEYCVDGEAHHAYLATQCLSIMNTELRRNICRLPRMGSVSKSPIDPTVLKANIKGALEYSCQFWYHHFRSGPSHKSQESQEGLQSFGEQLVLPWLEVMSLLSRLDEALSILHEAQYLDKVSSSLLLTQQLRDVKHMVKEHYSKIVDWPLNVYGPGEAIESYPFDGRDTPTIPPPLPNPTESPEQSITPLTVAPGLQHTPEVLQYPDHIPQDSSTGKFQENIASSTVHLEPRISNIQCLLRGEAWNTNRWTQGLSCSRCCRLVGDPIFCSVSTISQAITCQDCLFKEPCLRSETYILFNRLSKQRIGQHQREPELITVRPHCSLCSVLIQEGEAWRLCIGYRHAVCKSICNSCSLRGDRRRASGSPCIFVQCFVPSASVSTLYPPSTSTMSGTSWTPENVKCIGSSLPLERVDSGSSSVSLSPTASSSGSILATPPDSPQQCVSKEGTITFSPPSRTPSPYLVSPFIMDNLDDATHSVAPWSPQRPASIPNTHISYVKPTTLRSGHSDMPRLETGPSTTLHHPPSNPADTVGFVTCFTFCFFLFWICVLVVLLST